MPYIIRTAILPAVICLSLRTAVFQLKHYQTIFFQHMVFFKAAFQLLVQLQGENYVATPAASIATSLSQITAV